ncbi:MAG: hypothetical protein IJ177_01125 [Fibrobacter sp.]|uniref:hypothetical protein n=1 Tax=Fibrobacter sp. TaxID=35828 RepID=UPI0025BCA224|nr:hypothetical protein [Fibrobacter sp.]MBQ9224780.1 hypothetical protein [Fibrobacter sp.]
MNKKILTLLTAVSFAFFMSACGDDNSSGASVDCLDNEECLDDEIDSSDSDDAKSSSSVKKDDKSSSSKKDEKSSSSTKDESSSSVKDDSSSSVNSSSSAKDDKSSSSEKKDDESSSSEKKDEKSSSSEKVESSSSEPPVSSSSEEPESSSSVELKVTYLSETPNAADLEVSGDTLFAVFQRSYSDGSSLLKYENGLVALFKLSDGTLLDTIPLVTKNPQAIKMVKGSLYVGTQGEYNPDTWGIDADETRGIEKIDLKKKKSELWVSGTLLGGGVYMMDVDPISGKAVVAVYKAYQNVPAVEVDLNDKSVRKIDGVVDASGSIYFDRKGELFYIGDRGSINWDTYEMTPMVAYSYNGLKLTALYDDEMGYQPAGIAVINNEVFVYISDFSNAGKLYWIEYDEDEGNVLSTANIPFSTDTKIVEVNGGLYVMDRKGKGSISKVNTSAKTVEWQNAFLNKDNPYDIVAIDGSNAWVALYDVGEIRKISLGDGSTISSIDTKEFSAKKIEAAE